MSPASRPRRHRHEFVGQILFSPVDSPYVTIDCLLAPSGAPATALPTSFVLHLPERPRAAAAAQRMLESWAQSGVVVEMTLRDGRRGAELLLSGSYERVALVVGPS